MGGRRIKSPTLKKLLRASGVVLAGVALFIVCVAEIFQSPRRVAYIVSTNTSASRYVQTKNVLQRAGFETEVVAPKFLGETMEQRTFSNKLALLSAIQRITVGSEPWGYVFEDDINVSELSNATTVDIVSSEHTARRFQYLGVCLPKGESVRRFACGRCAHAMGFSKAGAKELVKFSEIDRLITPARRGGGIIPATEPYLDVIIDVWCQSRGGFQIVGPLKESVKSTVTGHIGMFIQDRGKFVSIVSNSPRVKTSIWPSFTDVS